MYTRLHQHDGIVGELCNLTLAELIPNGNTIADSISLR